MLDKLFMPNKEVFRSISPENFTGEKGKGGMATEGASAPAAEGLGQGWKVSPRIFLQPGETRTIADIQGSGIIKHIWFAKTGDTRKQILRIYYDGDTNHAVECPMSDFFCAAQESWQINALPICVNSYNAYNSYFEMPFKKSIKITIENLCFDQRTLYYQIDYVEVAVPEDALYFHAQFRRTNPLPYKEDYTIIDGIEAKGKYVGTYLFFGTTNNGWWGEGEIKFFMDGDKDFPTICGTGTEDYFCGAWCFNKDKKYIDYSTPYSGFHALYNDEFYASQQRFSMYRFHITDAINFEKDLRVTMQAIGWRADKRYLPLQPDMASVAYMYLDKTSVYRKPLPDVDYLEII